VSTLFPIRDKHAIVLSDFEAGILGYPLKRYMNTAFRSLHVYALLLILATGLCSLCSCHLFSAYTNMRDARAEIQGAQKEQILEEGLYHLAAAQKLLEAAEKEYEEADFGQASKLAHEAKGQVDLAIRVSHLYSGEKAP
jgi:hypothetical protein